MEKLVKYVIVTIFTVAIVSCFMSCATNGYGCRGKGKLITRVRQ
jgi:hypothetical protein